MIKWTNLDYSFQIFIPNINYFFQIPTLIHAMILTEVWKHKVFPIICKLQDFNPKSTFLLYMVVSRLNFK